MEQNHFFQIFFKKWDPYVFFQIVFKKNGSEPILSDVLQKWDLGKLSLPPLKDGLPEGQRPQQTQITRFSMSN